MTTALVFGAAGGVWEEIEAAKKLCNFDVIVAVKRPGMDYPGYLHHWVSFHGEMFADWILKRHKNGYPPAEKYWVSSYRGSGFLKVTYPTLNRIACEGGSSGLIGTLVGRTAATKIVLAGIPLDPERGHFNKSAPWKEALIHREAWKPYFPHLLGHVKSMSGWTQQMLGAPTEEWLNSECKTSPRSASENVLSGC